MAGPEDGASQPPGAEWEEAQCLSALAELERLQEKLDDLRLTIHRVVQPLSSPRNDRAQLFASYKKAVLGSQQRIKNFRTHWQSPQITSILDHSKASLQTNPDLTASAQVPRYGWQEKETAEAEAARRRKADGPKLDDVAFTLDKQEVASVVDEFQKTHPQIKVLAENDNGNLMIQFVAGALHYRFHVVVNEEANAKDKLSAECLGTTKPFPTISSCVSSRPRANDLKYLLDMIAAYQTVKGTTCAKCNRLLDKCTQTPTARRSRQTTNENGGAETVWEAFHASCLD